MRRVCPDFLWVSIVQRRARRRSRNVGADKMYLRFVFAVECRCPTSPIRHTENGGHFGPAGGGAPHELAECMARGFDYCILRRRALREKHHRVVNHIKSSVERGISPMAPLRLITSRKTGSLAV